MADILLCLHSEHNTRTSDFTINYSRPIDLSDGLWAVALDKIEYCVSWHNVDSSYNNRTFSYSDGVNTRIVTLPEGNYTVDLINEYLHEVMYANGDYTIDPVTGQPVYSISITPNYPTLRTRISVVPGWSVDLTLSRFHNLIGFNSVVVTATSIGAHHSNINRSMESIHVHCDLVTNSYVNSTNNDLLYQFAPQGFPGSKQTSEPRNRTFMPIRGATHVNRIRIYLTDQHNRHINFHGEPVAVTLVLRKISLDSIAS